MPGELKPNATCPHCESDLVAVVDTTNAEGVTREYFHAWIPGRVRRRKRCVFFFESHAAAAAERKALEK